MPPFARLAVDADDRLVGAAEIGRVDRQVGHFPDLAVRRLQRLEALVDGVLVRAREGGEHQVAAIGMARMDRQLVAVFDRLADLVDVGEVDLGIDALGEHVEAQGHEVDIAGALAVAEQAALDAVGAGHVAQLGRRHAGAAVVVRVQAEHDRIAVLEVAMAPFDLVGVDVGRGHLDRRRQVDDHLVLRRRLEDVADGGADVARELELGAGEALRRILEHPFGGRDRRRPAA